MHTIVSSLENFCISSVSVSAEIFITSGMCNFWYSSGERMSIILINTPLFLNSSIFCLVIGLRIYLIKVQTYSYQQRKNCIELTFCMGFTFIYFFFISIISVLH